MSDEFEPTFKRPSEQERKPVDSAGQYQRYWEEKDLERRRNAQRDNRCLNIYERARGEDWGRGRK